MLQTENDHPEMLMTLDLDLRGQLNTSSESILGESMIGAAIKDLRDELQKHISTIAVARDIQGVLPMDQTSLDVILNTSAQLRSLADRLDTLVTDNPSAATAVGHPNLLALQLQQYSKDLRAIRQQRNTARDALEDARTQALKKLAAAAELKDDDTGQHVVRMGYYCAAIARALGQPKDYCHKLLLASRMHDVGKIGIPDAILKKPGKLTPDEWIVMRTHPQIGAALMGDTPDPLFKLAAEVALVHHEKYDGSGYPNNLRGEQIPLSGRIVALADFFDAVTMDRCYRPAMSDEEALSLVRQGSGVHFDPKIVEAFWLVLEEIIAIRNRSARGELN